MPQTARNMFRFNIAVLKRSLASPFKIKVKTHSKLDFRYLLLPRETNAIREVQDKYRKKFKGPARKDKDLFIYLADSQTQKVTWSAVSKRIPTFRTQSAKMWHMQSNVWLSSRGKLASLGFPVTPGTALAMDVPMVAVSDTIRAAKIAGNSFQFGAIGVMQFVALVCLKDKFANQPASS